MRSLRAVAACYAPVDSGFCLASGSNTAMDRHGELYLFTDSHIVMVCAGP
jgi:hypothetical protein